NSSSSNGQDGQKKLSILSTDGKNFTRNSSTGPEQVAVDLIGCYNRSSDRKPTLFRGPFLDSKSMNHKLCRNLCLNLLANKTELIFHFGLSNGIECYCGVELHSEPRLSKLNLSECSLECPGDSDQKCGGKDGMLVYGINRELSADWKDMISDFNELK
uniref:WSC domain-containing protein n=1 Tax=Macrostomum lignano TaxID=282301 RepID=A0A1I8FX06_9PLAT